MRKKITLLLFIIFCCISAFPQSHTITGVVRDSISGEPLPGCTLLLLSDTPRSPLTRTRPPSPRPSPLHTLSDATGSFSFHLPTTATALVISYTGYHTDTIRILPGQDRYTIGLLPRIAGMSEAVVTTGVSKAVSIRENPVAIMSISSKKIDRTIESNVIDVLVKNAPGLNAVKTGPNISKPFIRGLGYNRVLTLYDGIRQEGQQWGDEHGIEVDAYNIQRAEVIKGPASIMYGSDAVAGVVSLFPYVPAEKDGRLHGKLSSEYQTNNGLVGNGVNLGYSAGHWLWSLRGSYRIAKNYQNPVDGRVYLTGFREKNASALVGYVSDKGFSHLNITWYDNLQGIPDGSRDSLTRKFTYQVDETGQDNIKDRPLVPEQMLNSYALSPLHQHIQHYRIYTNNHYKIGAGSMDATLGFQQNIRREYNHPTDPDQAGLFVRLNTVNYGLRYNLPAFSGIDVSAGVNGMVQDNKNKDATDFPIPDYRLLDLGAFLYGKWKHDDWTISGGLRRDSRRIRGNDFYIHGDPVNGFDYQAHIPDTAGATLQFPALRQDFSGLSLSLGATWRFNDRLTFKANVARGYRAPNITEIASNGLDPGAHIVYLGNRDFVPEFSFEEDLGLLAHFPDLDASISFFNNEISNYIYLTQLQDAQGNPVTLVPGNRTFQYKQAAARLYGMEMTLDIHPVMIKGLTLANSFHLTYGDNRKPEYRHQGVNGQYLPLIPPPMLLSSINQEIPLRGRIFTGLTAQAGLEWAATQDRYLALDNTETATPGYTLLNLGVGTTISCAGNSTLQFLLQMNNVCDVAYQSNLSRLKYFEYYTYSPNGHLGIYSMGRNMCLKMIMSF